MQKGSVATKVDPEALADEQFEGGLAVNEDPDKCCFVVPIKTGVIIIAVCIVVEGVLTTLDILDILGASYGGINFIMALAFFGAAAAANVLALLLCIPWLRAMDDKDAISKLPKACMLMVLSTLLRAGWILWGFLAIHLTFSALLTNAIVTGFFCIVWIYCSGVTKRYAESS